MTPLYEQDAKSYVSKILFLKNDHSPITCYQALKKYNIKNLTYLKKLNAFIGLFQRNTSYDNFKNLSDIYLIDEDIEVKIYIPKEGKIATKSQVVPWGIRRIGADKYWHISQGSGVKIAVIDTGIAYDHPDLKDNIKGGINILDTKLSPYDDNGHGTHVAGTIGAVNNQSGIVGVAPRASLYAVKTFNKDGTAKLSNIIKAIDWSIENEMDIINMSFGFTEPSPTFREAIKRAHKSKVLMIAASGNKGTRGLIEYPAQYNETIGISSINENNEISDFSAIGPQVNFTAPGENINSTWLNDSFRELSGTSMSVAHVSGVAALVISKSPSISPDKLVNLLKHTAEKLNNINPLAQGAGVVNAKIISNKSY